MRPGMAMAGQAPAARDWTGLLSDRQAGSAAMALTVLIWSGFALSVRSAHGSALAFADVALIRAGVATLVFLPFLPSRIGRIRRAGVARLGLIAAGAGLPFLWLATAGGAMTSAAHVGALIAGTVPVSVAVLGARWPGRRKAAALAVILAGAALLVGARGGLSAGAVPGAGLLLLASLLWAGYTLALRDSGLDPISVALVVAVPTALATLAGMATGLVPSHAGQFTLQDAAPFLLVQGLGVGVVSTLTYAFALSRLGAAQAATLGSLSPALTAVLAVPLLGEALTALAAVAVALVCAGVLAASVIPAATPARDPVRAGA